MADPDEIARSFVLNGWNTYHIIAKGNLIIQILNGRVSVIMIDEAENARAMEGVLGLQMHNGSLDSRSARPPTICSQQLNCQLTL